MRVNRIDFTARLLCYFFRLLLFFFAFALYCCFPRSSQVNSTGKCKILSYLLSLSIFSIDFVLILLSSTMISTKNGFSTMDVFVVFICFAPKTQTTSFVDDTVPHTAQFDTGKHTVFPSNFLNRFRHTNSKFIWMYKQYMTVFYAFNL